MKKILVTGGNGLVGNAIRSIAQNYPDFEFHFATHKDADLTKQSDVAKLFDTVKPDYVIHTAARVGGIGKNLASPAEQFYHNILMNTYVIDEAYRHGVAKLLAFSSVCAFPDGATILKEEILHDGPPYHAHGSYAYSKRMVDVQIRAYRQQYGIKQYSSILPVNIFGECDNYDLKEGHVLPSLIHKCYIAKQNNTPFEVWGTGVVKREFCYAKDLARVCVDLLQRDENIPELLIVSNSEELSIKDVVEKVCKYLDYDNVKWLVDAPLGQLRRPSDSTRFRSVFPDFKFTDVDTAVKNSVDWFIANYPNVRGT